MDPLFSKIAPNSISCFAIVRSGVLNFDMLALENDSRVCHIDAAFSQNLATLLLVILNFHFDKSCHLPQSNCDITQSVV